MNAVEQQIAVLMPDIFADVPAETGAAHTGIIPNGQRNSVLTSKAGTMRRAGFPTEAIAPALHSFNAQRCRPPLDASEVDAIARSVSRYEPAREGHAIGYTLAEIATHTFPPRRPILVRHGTPVLREGDLGQIFAERGTGKTWVTTTLALVAASATEALGFSAPVPVRTLVIDGEMASTDLQARTLKLAELLCLDAPAVPLTLVAADWQQDFLPRLDTAEGQRFVEPFIENADLVIIDNRSCLFDPEGEKDPTAWQPAQDFLLKLRRRGKAVLLVHHSNRQGGARGHSKAEDPLDLMIKLARPEGYSAAEGARFVVSFEKTRGPHGPAVAPFEAHLTPNGWQMNGIEPPNSRAIVAAKLLDYVRLASAAGESPKSATTAISGAKVNKAAGLKAWADLLERGAIVKHPTKGFHAA